MKAPTVLTILDGLGYREEKKYNAVAQAKTPTLNYLKEHYPHTIIQAAGTAVGLRPGMMGNSEVGHLTIGTGRIIEQPIRRIDNLIDSKQLEHLPFIKNHFTHLAQTGKCLHLLGLISDAGVHSDIKHLYAFITIAHNYHIKKIIIHPFLDGRDTPPESATTYLTELDHHIATIPEAKIASICGRFYAMDRNQEWDRTKEAYDMLTEKMPLEFTTWQTALNYYYDHHVTDEFIPPTQLDHEIVDDGDGILFFNFRPDRARQLTEAFIDKTFNRFPIKKLNLAFFITPVEYAKNIKTESILPTEPIKHTLMEILAEHNFSTFAIAETEKYAHVTYFFNAGRETKYPRENRIIIPSITAETYKDIPEMQADKITKTVINSLEHDPHDFYLINYANPDMVGHSGDFEATVKAVESVDRQLKKLYEQVVEKMNGTLYATADHGNAETMWDEKSNQPVTSHTNNPVEFIFVNQSIKDKKIVLSLRGLKDIAPFILENLKLPIPTEMKP